jgi:hypothetical protein
MEKHWTLKQRFLEELHSSPIACHSSFHKTYEQTKCSFFREVMKIDIQYFVASYDIF